MATEKRLIDANEALRMMRNSKSDNPCINPTRKGVWNVAHDCAISCVDACPTADAVEVVHGEWIDAKFVRAVKGTNLPVVRCSKCECYFCDVINNHHYMYHYCPNCGAKMDGGTI